LYRSTVRVVKIKTAPECISGLKSNGRKKEHDQQKRRRRREAFLFKKCEDPAPIAKAN